MRRVVMPLCQACERREKRLLSLDMKGDAEELGAIDLLPKLGECGDGAVMVHEVD
jgi:hypothetical protein